MNLNCIIDTCSCIYLSNTEFRQETLLKHLNESATLKYSKEVHAELRDHKEKNLPPFILQSSRKITPRKYSLNEYERRMLGKVLDSRKKKGNKGEVDNLIVAVDEIYHNGKNSVIFITDDENETIFSWTESFPVIKIWTSYEVVLFLYGKGVIPSKDIANNLIKDIISVTAPKESKRSEKTTQKFIKILGQYNQRIEKISKLLKN